MQQIMQYLICVSAKWVLFYIILAQDGIPAHAFSAIILYLWYLWFSQIFEYIAYNKNLSLKRNDNDNVKIKSLEQVSW